MPVATHEWGPAVTPNERLADLHERRDFLLRSIDDLEREYAAGDMTGADFDLLHRDYSRRAADVLTELEGVGDRAVEPSPPSPVERAIQKKARILKLLAGLGIVLFALASGIFVSKIAGVRSGNDGLTGSVNAAGGKRAQVENLLSKGRDNMSSNPLEAIKAFDQAAELDPEQVEALAYGGWVLRLVGLGAHDEAQKRELIGGAIARLDRAIEINPRYADARAFRAIIRLRDLGDAKASLEDFVALDAMMVPSEVQALVGNARIEAEQTAATQP